jgi:hypothetical protein
MLLAGRKPCASTRPDRLARAVRCHAALRSRPEEERMKGGWILIVTAALMMPGCSRGEGDRAPVSGEAQPDRTGPMRPPEAHIEGNFVLTTVDGLTVPAALDEGADCRTELVDATLRLEAGRFAFQNRVREVCGGIAQEPVLHAAGGSYIIDGTAVTLRSDVGGAFAEARGIADETSLTLQRLSVDAGAQNVSWRFERLGPELVPPAGTMQGTP